MYDLHSIDPRYPKNWNKLRFWVFTRDKYTCQMCKRKIKHPVCHHVIPLGKGGSNHPNNLVTVCPSCHEKIHGKRRR